MSLSVTHPLGNTSLFYPCEGNPEAPDLARHEQRLVSIFIGLYFVCLESFPSVLMLIPESLYHHS